MQPQAAFESPKLYSFAQLLLKLPSYSHNNIWQIFCKIEVPSGLLLTTGHIDEVFLMSLSYLLP